MRLSTPGADRLCDDSALTRADRPRRADSQRQTGTMQEPGERRCRSLAGSPAAEWCWKQTCSARRPSWQFAISTRSFDRNASPLSGPAINRRRMSYQVLKNLLEAGFQVPSTPCIPAMLKCRGCRPFRRWPIFPSPSIWRLSARRPKPFPRSCSKEASRVWEAW